MKQSVQFGLLFVCFLVCLPQISRAQVSLSITGTRPNAGIIDLSTVTTAGDYKASVTDATKTLNYKYKDYTSWDYARIDASITSGTIPQGLSIKLTVPGSANTSKAHSTSNGTVTLSNSGSSLILYNIYNTNDNYTITGLISMLISVTNYSLLRSGSTPLTITYTISTYNNAL